MKKEADQFWESDGRLNKLQELGMTKEEVYTLASIVDKETLADAEKPTVAGLYLNRLKMGMPLQADPTVVFANNDFTIKRVTNKHTAIKSPYNTYLNKGLPPGPISMATASGIDAVLNHEKHNYLYMCARPDTPEGITLQRPLRHTFNLPIYIGIGSQNKDCPFNSPQKFNNLY